MQFLRSVRVARAVTLKTKAMAASLDDRVKVGMIWFAQDVSNSSGWWYFNLKLDRMVTPYKLTPDQIKQIAMDTATINN